ncbi:MAG: hypothetical protein H7839_20345, partial [Magnetococcus sp. YQC-5]
ELYENACIAIINARGAVINARMEGVEEGIQIGEERGETRGVQKGKADILTRMLQYRFGAIPDWASKNILTAEPSVLEAWTLRMLDATTLDAVFTDRV